MKQHFLKLRAGPSWCELGSLTIINSLFQFGTEGLRVGLHMLASQWEDTHIHTNTHANVTSLQSWPSWLKRRLPGCRERKEGKGLYKCTSPKLQGSNYFWKFYNSVENCGEWLAGPGAILQCWTPTMYEAFCQMLYFMVFCRRQVGWDAGERSRLSAKAFILFWKMINESWKSHWGEISRRLIRNLLPQVRLNFILLYNPLKSRLDTNI